jgi:hypothetical protein
VPPRANGGGVLLGGACRGACRGGAPGAVGAGRRWKMRAGRGDATRRPARAPPRGA